MVGGNEEGGRVEQRKEGGWEGNEGKEATKLYYGKNRADRLVSLPRHTPHLPLSALQIHGAERIFAVSHLFLLLVCYSSFHIWWASCLFRL